MIRKSGILLLALICTHQASAQSLPDIFKRVRPTPRRAIPDRYPQQAWVIGDTEVARIVAPAGCSDDMRIELRYKAGAEPYRQQWLDPKFYVDGQHGVNLISYYGGKRNYSSQEMMCVTKQAELTIFAPNGSVIGRDMLTRSLGRGKWASEKRFGDLERSVSASNGTTATTTATDTKDVSRRLSEIAQLAQRTKEKCEEPLRQKYGHYERPASAAAAAERRQQAQADYVACQNKSKEVGNGFVARIAQGVSAKLQQLPATYDGLKAINRMEDDYRTNIRVTVGTPSAGYASDLVTKVNTATALRRSQIEHQLFNQIVADMNKPDGGPDLISSLFGYADKRRATFYDTMYYDPAQIDRIPKRPGSEKLFMARTTDIAKSAREKSQGASAATWTEPTSNEMGLALMRGFIALGGKQVTKNVVTVPGALNRLGFDQLDEFSGMLMQFQEVRKTACKREAPGYRCSYVLHGRPIARGEVRSGLGGMIMQAIPISPGGTSATTLFVPTKSGWRAPEAEQAGSAAQMRQIQQLSDVATRIVDAGANAMQVLIDTRSGATAEPGEVNQAEQERQDRVKASEQRDQD